MSYDCAVIGGGVSGMTAAVIMAGEGYRTVLLEASPQTAPTVRGFTRRGIFFDTGFHYTGGLDDGGPLDIFFRYLGLSEKIGTYPFRESGFDTFRCLDPCFEFPFPYGYERIRESLHRAFPGEAAAINTHLNAVRGIYHAQPYLNLEVSGQGQGLSLDEEATLEAHLNALTDDEMLKSILTMHCMLHGVSPGEVSLTSHASVAGSYYESAHGITGGGRSLAEAFDARLKELNVEVLCGVEAREIILSGDHSVEGLRTSKDEVLGCGRCISTIHPRQMLRLVPAHAFRPIYRKRLEALEDTCSAIILYIEADLVPGNLDGTNLVVFPTPRFPDLEHDSPMEGKPLFITRAGQAGGGGATREGYIAICPEPHLGSGTAAALPPDRPEDYRTYKEDVKKRAVAHLEASCPEFKGRITHVECATPHTLKRFTNSPAGSLYGVKHKAECRNPIPLTKVGNLFLSGQATTAPGILGAVVSGFAACGTIVGHEKLMGELRRLV